MAKKNESASQPNQSSQPTPPLVYPGERALLLSHFEYRQTRALGRGLDEYDLLMRQPDDVGAEQGDASADERWLPVPANKYLKHRAIGWREAQSLDELPPNWQAAAADRNAFPAAPTRKRGGK